jgi:Polyketide synthase dehydratase
VIGQRLGIFLNELDDAGGLDTSVAETAWEAGLTTGPMTGKVASLSISGGYTIETTLDPHIQPFLHDHQIDGTPVLPGVMGIEAFAEAALCLLPGWQVEAVEDITFLAPFKFYRNEPRALQIETRVHPAGEKLLADCRLIGQRFLPNQIEPQLTTHFTARVRLAKHAAQAPSPGQPAVPAGNVIEAGEIYQLYFHGPAYQVLEKAWWDGKRVIGLMARNLPADHSPAELPLAISPRLIELCFQTAGIWEMGLQGRMGLPQRVGQVSLFRAPSPGDGPLYALVTPDPDQGSFKAEVLDTKGNCYLRVAGYQTVAVDVANSKRLRILQGAMSGEAVLAA